MFLKVKLQEEGQQHQLVMQLKLQWVLLKGRNLELKLLRVKQECPLVNLPLLIILPKREVLHQLNPPNPLLKELPVKSPLHQPRDKEVLLYKSSKPIKFQAQVLREVQKVHLYSNKNLQRLGLQSNPNLVMQHLELVKHSSSLNLQPSLQFKVRKVLNQLKLHEA